MEEQDSSTYFSRREHELLLLNKRLEEHKAKALEATEAALIEAKARESKKSPRSPKKHTNRPSSQSLAAARTFEQAPISLVPDINGRENLETGIPSVVIGPSGQELESLQATVRYQKARVMALQEELDRVVKAAQEREAETQLLRNEMKVAVDENRRIMKKLTTAEADLDRLTKRNASGDTRVKELEEQLVAEKKDHDADLAAMRKLDQESRNKDLKINRLLEENERLKSTVRDVKSADRERGTAERDQMDKLQNDSKRLMKQRSELIIAFKKQARLIDILRKQKTHLEAARMLAFTEDEFVNVVLGSKQDENPKI